MYSDQMRPTVPAFAGKWVGAVAGLAAALLSATADGYGYHRDELYFRVLGQHPAWGYIDQPPLTPLLARLSTAVFGDHLWALRLPAIACAAAVTVLLALIARELGGGRSAQTIAAVGGVSAELLFDHVLFTNAVDDVVWSAVLLFVIRALTRPEPRWWLAVGVAAGLGTYNKYLVVMLLVSLGIGLLLTGPRRVLASRWVWIGAGVALVVGAPNLIYQATHDWPQLAMSAAIAENEGAGNRQALLYVQLLLLGPLLVAFEIAGLVMIWRDKRLRALAAAYPVMCVIMYVTAGQPYYTFALMLTLFAAGCVALERWLATRRGPGVRFDWALVWVALAANAVVAAFVALPLRPLSEAAASPLGVNVVVPYQLGWPTYVAQVTDVYRALPAEDQASSVIITDNYGQAGAIARFGDEQVLPPVLSGHNSWWDLGNPPESATVAILVGCFASADAGDPCPPDTGDHWDYDQNLLDRFASCEVAATLDNGIGIDNEEGTPVRVCRSPREPWARLWADFRHID